MDQKHIEALNELFSNLDCSIAKGVGDCLQVVAKMALTNLSRMESPSTSSISESCDVSPDIPKRSATNPMVDLDDEDQAFFSSPTHTVLEVADFIGRSKGFVIGRIGDEFIATKDDVGRWLVDTESVRKYLFESSNGNTSKT